MILLCAGQKNPRNFDAMILFATQLSQRGHRVAIDADFAPENLDRHQKYEVVPYLSASDALEFDQVCIIGAEAISSDVQVLLRKFAHDADLPVTALGTFKSHHNAISAQNSLAYVLGREPRVIDLAQTHKRPLLEAPIAPLCALDLGQSETDEKDSLAKVLLYLPADALEDPQILPTLGMMDQMPGFDLNIVIAGEGKDRIRQSKFAHLSVFGYAEMSPLTLVQMFDIAVFFGANIPGERMALLALCMMQSGKVVIDCTSGASFLATGAPALHGPEDMEGLNAFLQHSVLINRSEIGQVMAQNKWLEDFSIETIERQLDLTADTKPDVEAKSKTVFFPTNGSGLGHAQRCAVVGEQMQIKPTFAAFPSCVDMLRGRGFACLPLIQRTDAHLEQYANDMVNYTRLRRLLGRGDTLVFDGGYVFDSAYRLIAELGLNGIWIRRGLWQKGQINPHALERETVFSKVIVPREAFDELNTTYSFGAHLHDVGPIVNTEKLDHDEIASLRLRLAAQMDVEFDQLIVTMLGGGVASDRAAQMQLLCNMAERRENCLHLIIAWPNAVIAPGLYGWKNTRVIQTQKAQAIAQAADLTISAVGYNSFHETLYNQIPTIFMPQAADYLDDQERRARAASERDLAATVLGTELMQLEREVTAFLDEGKADMIRTALAEIDLPELGNTSAARLIEGSAP